MSAEELRRRSVEALSESRDRAVEYSLNVRFRPASYGQSAYTPAVTAEEIALQVLEGNALARAYTAAISVVNDVYRMMHEPEDDKKRPEQRERKEVY